MERTLTGRVSHGLGRGSGFTMLPRVRAAFVDHFGIDPHPGTLNLQLTSARELWVWAGVRSGSCILLLPADPDQCAARCFPVRIGDRLLGRIPGAVVVPQVEGYPPDRIEVVAPVPLRQTLNVEEGAELGLDFALLPELSALVFDVDGTLVNSLDAYRQAAVRAAGSSSYPVTLDAVRTALNTNASFWDLVLKGHPDHSAERVAQLRAETLRHWPAVVEEAVQLCPGVDAVLRNLRSAGLKLGLCTGSGGESFGPLERAGLLDCFDVIVTAKDVRHRKPHPEGLLRCLEVLGVEPSAAAYVGDSPLDIAAARSAGMTAIGVLSGAGGSALLAAAGADRLLREVRLLPELLGRGVQADG